MTNVSDFRSARATALSLFKSLERVAQLSAANPGLVRMATDGNGDRVAFWNDGTALREVNISLTQRRIAEIQKHYPDALKSRSKSTAVRAELPWTL